jgi:Sir2 family
MNPVPTEQVDMPAKDDKDNHHDSLLESTVINLLSGLWPASAKTSPTGRRAPTERKIQTPFEEKQANPKLNILKDDSIESFADYINKNQCKKIIVMTGAGISTSAGIPDFRTPGTGLYDNLQK